jgi:uncharacterized protein (UPF0212 family)
MLVKWPFFSTLDFVDDAVSRGFFGDSLCFQWEVFFVDSDFSALDFVEIEVGHWLAAPSDLEGCVDDEALDFTEVELGDKVVIACEPATTVAAEALDFTEVELGDKVVIACEPATTAAAEALDFTEVELGDNVVIACEPATTAAADPAAKTFAKECVFALSGTIGFFDSATLVFVEGCRLGLD